MTPGFVEIEIQPFAPLSDRRDSVLAAVKALIEDQAKCEVESEYLYELDTPTNRIIIQNKFETICTSVANETINYLVDFINETRNRRCHY